MRSAVRRMGNSSGVIIPKPLLQQIGAKVGDDLEMSVEGGRLVVTPVSAHPRAAWADDARRIAEAGDDALVLPEFANADDETLTW
jgi:antitoxin MazE